MSSLAVGAVVSAFRVLLQPIAPFTWFGLGISTFDVAAAFRLCLVLRQMREMTFDGHLKTKNQISSTDEKGGDDVEATSYMKSVAVTLVVVFGGEAIMCPWLNISPSFVFSPVVPGLFAALTILVESLPTVPTLSFESQFPLSLFDGMTRAFLVCQVIPPMVLSHSQPVISSSPWTLVFSSLITANAGFFLVNLCSMMHPAGWSLVTPAELRAYGWTTMDVWAAPLTTALYALLTHAQPFWADLHGLLVQFLGEDLTDAEKLTSLSRGEAPDNETALAVCSIFLATLFAGRTAYNLGGPFLESLSGEKKSVIRSKVDGRRLKTKTQ